MKAVTRPPLTLASGLGALTLEELNALAKNLGVNGTLSSKARYLSLLPERLSETAVVRKLIRGLGAGERRVLHQASACERLMTLGGTRLLWERGVKTPPPGLIEKGLLLPDALTGVYRVPAEIAAEAYAEATREFITGGAARNDDAVSLDEKSAFRDALTIWCFVAKNPITLNQSGAAPKRFLTKVAPLLEVDEDADPYAAVIGELGISRLEILVNELQRRGALVRHEGGLRAAPWLGPDPGRTEEGFAAALVAAAVIDDETGGALLAAYALSLAAPTCPLTVGGALSKIAATNGSTNGDGCRRVFTASFVGGFAVACSPGGPLALYPRGDALPNEPQTEITPSFLVGANFEVKIPYDVPAATRLKLEAFADQTDGGKLLSYAINKTSFYRALDAGVTAEDIRSYLERYSSKPLPQNVAFSLADWNQQYGAVSFHRGTLVVADSAAVADEIANIPAIKDAVKNRRTLHALEIADDDYAAVREALLAAGHLPKSLPGNDEPVSAALLFGGQGDETPRVAGKTESDAKYSLFLFAMANGRRLRLWLAGAKESLSVAVLNISASPLRQIVVEATDGVRRIPLETVEKAALI